MREAASHRRLLRSSGQPRVSAACCTGRRARDMTIFEGCSLTFLRGVIFFGIGCICLFSLLLYFSCLGSLKRIQIPASQVPPLWLGSQELHSPSNWLENGLLKEDKA